MPKWMRLLRDQLTRKIQFGFNLMYDLIKPNLVEGAAPRKANPWRQWYHSKGQASWKHKTEITNTLT
ncbi:hypothetical protein B4W74_06510 [Staphylococcus intermedius]|nr:hypothetical protein B5C04_06160 [Staphylococcus intermedius]PCF81313.1 hypothetical protein B4W74_06510 [Staphylococcus intermedius]PCF82596.1 hypothetical protein B4W70_06155 [Staphylococcus intermedius]PCF87295.1 hypothetical protein B4W75_09425 [Staphylococcus intermedius]PNZ53987.1 hypothetical protein CD138_03595 [Staphylococcus intermedius NCTC 11048]